MGLGQFQNMLKAKINVFLMHKNILNASNTHPFCSFFSKILSLPLSNKNGENILGVPKMLIIMVLLNFKKISLLRYIAILNFFLLLLVKLWQFIFFASFLVKFNFFNLSIVIALQTIMKVVALSRS